LIIGEEKDAGRGGGSFSFRGGRLEMGKFGVVLTMEEKKKKKNKN
jgi:hypothetical protein